MRVLVTGGSGFIGSALVPALEADGHQVTRLVRSPASTGPHAFLWDPVAGTIDEAALAGIDAAVHLSGETIAGRWTAAKKRRIRESRVESTRLLSEALGRLERHPGVLVCASATGYYGDRGSEELTEVSPPGAGFLAELTREWEAATGPAAAAGIRVVSVRSGIVLSGTGGALARMLPAFRLGAGAVLGSGRQYMSWITLEDEVRAMLHALSTERLSGAVNAVAPNPVTNREFTKTLGRVLGRPALLRAPAPVLRAVLGELAGELLLSQRVLPMRLLETAYRFRHPELEEALRHAVRQRRR